MTRLGASNLVCTLRARRDARALSVVALVAGLLAVAVVVFAPSADSAPVRPVQNGMLAFSSELHAAEIYVMNADGSGAARITNEDGPSRWPTLSPDGSRVAFASLRNGMFGIYVSNLDGSGLIDISLAANLPYGFDGYPDWSPDGTKLAFTDNTTPDGPLDIVVYDLVHNTLTDLSPEASVYNRRRLSRVGRKLF